MTTTTSFTFEQLCRVTDLPDEVLVEIVQLGIVCPEGEEPDHWTFDAEMLCLVRRALRLHRELEINWPGVALAMELLQRLEQSRAENRRLQGQLNRFLKEG